MLPLSSSSFDSKIQSSDWIQRHLFKLFVQQKQYSNPSGSLINQWAPPSYIAPPKRKRLLGRLILLRISGIFSEFLELWKVSFYPFFSFDSFEKLFSSALSIFVIDGQIWIRVCNKVSKYHTYITWKYDFKSGDSNFNSAQTATQCCFCGSPSLFSCRKKIIVISSASSWSADLVKNFCSNFFHLLVLMDKNDVIPIKLNGNNYCGWSFDLKYYVAG